MDSMILCISVVMFLLVPYSVYIFPLTLVLSVKINNKSSLKLSIFIINKKSILTKTSTIRVNIPIDLSTWSCILLHRFFDSCRAPPLLTPSLV